MAKELQKRSEVSVENTWNLADMYETVEDWEKDLAMVSEYGAQLEALEGKVAQDADTLFTVLDISAKMNQKLMLCYSYASRLYDEDQSNTTHQAMTAKVFTLAAGLGESTAFIEPEILAVDEEVLEGYFAQKPELELHRKQIGEIQRLKAHCLSAEMEKVVAMTSEMSQTASETFSVLDNADLKFPEVKDENGEPVQLSHGRFIPLMSNEDREVRKHTFEAYYSVFKQFLNTHAALYNGQIKQQTFHAKVRHYNSNLESSVLDNNVSPDVYYNLINAVDQNLDALHDYVSLRKKCLGLDEIHMYDVYTPMIPNMSKTVSYEEAKETVLKALEPLGEDYLSMLREGFENRWIDVYENQGKRSGAYSAGAYGAHPYVLLNYSSTLDDMFTLAHEMGHALHSCYSNMNQPYIYSDYTIFVAEVASTCNEILLLEYLVKHAADDKERAYLLNHYLDMFKGTLFRQTQFAEFELRTNEMVEQGESLNADNLSELYLEINKKYYGEEMISDEQIAWEWARIPHFYYNFYVYQYATSFSAAVAIAHQILEGKPGIVEKYKEFLSGGCSMPPVDLLKIVGVDMTTAQPFESAIEVMRGVLAEMETLI